MELSGKELELLVWALQESKTFISRNFANLGDGEETRAAVAERTTLSNKLEAELRRLDFISTP